MRAKPPSELTAIYVGPREPNLYLALLPLLAAVACVSEPPPRFNATDLPEAAGIELHSLGEPIPEEDESWIINSDRYKLVLFELTNHSTQPIVYFGLKNSPTLDFQLLMPSGGPWQNEILESCGNWEGPEPRWRVLDPGATVRTRTSVELSGAQMRARAFIKIRKSPDSWEECVVISAPFSRDREILVRGGS